jgi:hypothetical protein
MTMQFQMGRDPFARHTVRKRRVYSGRDCEWCGSFRNAPDGERYLFQYYIDADNPRGSGDMPGLFCSIQCCRSYAP